MPKFDLAIMNPPYDGNLHLKILEKVILVTEETINISPSSWIDDYAAVKCYKKSPKIKYVNSLGPKIVQYNLLDSTQFNNIFCTSSWSGVLISKLRLESNLDLYKQISEKTTIQKQLIEKLIMPIVRNERKSLLDMYGVNKDKYKFFIKMARVHGRPGLKDEYDLISPVFERSFMKNDKEGKEIYFETKEEAINFWHSVQSVIYKYVKSLGASPGGEFNSAMTWLEDYSESWTDERLCKFFDITKEEWEEIVTFMNKYQIK